VHFLTILQTADNGLSFIETSALDATNVDQSFQQILTGKMIFWAYFFK
jgi:hypothetical protein